MSKLPLYPPHPEKVCWGCDLYCPVREMTCGNGSERTPHPIELFGEDWIQWATERLGEPPVPLEPASPLATKVDAEPATARPLTAENG